MSSKTIYECQNCGAEFPKWQGQCSQCQKWNSLVEQVVTKSKTKSKKHKKVQSKKKIIDFSEVESLRGSKNRFSTSISELDRVLGGGLVTGLIALVGGEPGIGKSTILTQMVLGFINQNQKLFDSNRKKVKVLYVCGEESPTQISLRINRIRDSEQQKNNKNTAQSSPKIKQNLKFITTTDIDEILQIIDKENPDLVVVDSIQTVSTQDLSGASGSVGQIRECTDRLISLVKLKGCACFIVGHVTKDGTIAGPKILEHMVDVVLQLSGERTGQLRLLRALKNRFGATDEVGVFKMMDWGFKQIINPTEMFLENAKKQVPGSAIVCLMEGTRPLLVEVQALVVQSHLAMPRRVGRGIELSRIQVLSAVLQKHCGLPLDNYDIFLSVVGGFKIKEPAVDLGLAVAIASSLKDKSVPRKAVFIGEIGLLGEIRAVNFLKKRIKEVKRMGFDQIYCSKDFNNVEKLFKDLKLK